MERLRRGFQPLRSDHLAKETGFPTAVGQIWLKLHHLRRHEGQQRLGSPQTQSALVR